MKQLEFTQYCFDFDRWGRCEWPW